MTSEYRMKLRSSAAKRKAGELCDDNGNQQQAASESSAAQLYLHGSGEPNDGPANSSDDGDDGDQNEPAPHYAALFDDESDEADQDDNDDISRAASDDDILRVTPPPPEIPRTPIDLNSIFPPSPYGKSREPRIYGDRFIPLRDPNLVHDYNMHEPPSLRNPRHPSQQTEEEAARDLHERRMFQFYRSEVLHAPDTVQNFIETEADIGTNHVRTPRRLYKYSSPRAEHRPLPHASGSSNHHPHHHHHVRESPFLNASPISDNGIKIMNALQRPTRYVNRTAIKILDAPDLQDDFYLNLVDWGSDDCLAVGLGTCVYLWDANTSRVTKLCDLMDDTSNGDDSGSNNNNNKTARSDPEQVTSVNWAQHSKHLAIGTNRSRVLLWDVKENRKVRSWRNHTARVGSLAWNRNILSSASRDHHIYHHDVRSPAPFFREMNVHTQEVCGLKWSLDGSMLASGGNDNKLVIWNSHENLVLHTFGQHTAAVKALAWSPHERSCLVSGGGTADKTIKFWNAQRGTMLDSYDTGSQVCNVAWSKRSQEIVSTHGFANQHVSSSNQVIVWNAKTMHRVATLTGHSSRVLFMSMDNSGSTIVTGAGDETLRFWDVFAGVEPPRKEINKVTTLR
ncbi:unnamed protein product [Absidia cylindrospora]